MKRNVVDCAVCFLKGCNCSCATCVGVRERNDRLSVEELLKLELAEAVKFHESRKLDRGSLEKVHRLLGKLDGLGSRAEDWWDRDPEKLEK